MQANNAPSVERQLSMLLSLTAKLLHVVILQSHLIYLWLIIIQKALMLTPPLQHRHTWNGYLLTGRCCSRGRVPFVLLLSKRRRVFFSGYTFGYGPKTTGATSMFVSHLVHTSLTWSLVTKNPLSRHSYYTFLCFNPSVGIPLLDKHDIVDSIQYSR